MKPLSVVVAQRNPESAESLARSLQNHFRVVTIAGNIPELRHAIPRYRADVAIVDLELADVDNVHELLAEFPATSIVCTHRVADEKMWTQALSAGASDCCFSSDIRAIVLAATHTRPLSHAHAA